MPMTTPMPRFSQLLSAIYFLAFLLRSCHLIKFGGVDCQDLLQVAVHLVWVVMVLGIWQLCCISENQPIYSLKDIARVASAPCCLCEVNLSISKEGRSGGISSLP